MSCACMSKLLPPKYYKNNKERQKKKNACEDIKIYLKKKKKKKVVIWLWMLQKFLKGWMVWYRKNIKECEKTPYYKK